MQALTAIAATAYALTLWMFAPRTVWERELATAKRNHQNRLNATPETIQETENQSSEQPQTEAIPESIPQLDTTPEIIEEAETVPPEPTPQPDATEQSIPETVEQAISTPQGTDYTGWTTTQLREEAKRLKLNWRPLIDGKRTPLKKPQLIALLTT